MTNQPRTPSEGGDLPPVDQVIHDIRESSGHLRTPDEEAAEPMPASPAGAATPVTATAPVATVGHEPRHGSEPAGSSAHAADAHGDEHVDHGGESLGPIDWANWAAGAFGVAIALVVTVCFVAATQGLSAY